MKALLIFLSCFFLSSCCSEHDSSLFVSKKYEAWNTESVIRDTFTVTIPKDVTPGIQRIDGTYNLMIKTSNLIPPDSLSSYGLREDFTCGVGYYALALKVTHWKEI